MKLKSIRSSSEGDLLMRNPSVGTGKIRLPFRVPMKSTVVMAVAKIEEGEHRGWRVSPILIQRLAPDGYPEYRFYGFHLNTS